MEFLYFCSMGGALAVHLAHRSVLPTLAAMVVIDVVEGLFRTYWFFLFLAMQLVGAVTCSNCLGSSSCSDIVKSPAECEEEHVSQIFN